MAVIYDFALYRLPRVLRSVSEQAGDVVRQLEEQERQLDHLEEGVQKMCDAMSGFDDELEHHRERLARSMAQNRSCQEAAASASLSQMIAARDRLARTKPH